MHECIDSFSAAIAAAGLPVPEAIIADGVLHRFATNGRRGDLAGWYVLHLDGVPAGRFGDFRSGSEHWWRAEHSGGTRVVDFKQIAANRRARDERRLIEDASRRRAALRLWSSAESAIGTDVERYLASRGLHVPAGDALRFAASLPHRDGGTFPAMLALVQNVRGEPIAVHRTFLAPAGAGKASVTPNKMMLGPVAGGAVRLARADGETLMVGEGIETTLSVIQASGRPGWAALSAGGMEALQLPAHVRDVVILADGDERGERAAQAAGARWVREGRKVRIARPPAGLDFNDLLMRQHREARA